MGTSDVKITPGAGQSVATYSISEDAETKQIQRIVRSDSLGNELGNSTSSSVTSVDSSNSNVTLLSANSSRKGATISNDSTSVLYIKLGATASSTSYTVSLAGASSAPFTYYEVPFDYRGRIDGIWGSSNGAARVTELT